MEKKLLRELSLFAVIAAALCNVIGGGINVLIVEIQNDIIGIGNYVPLAMIVAGIPALLISLVYASISTAFPRPGGEYLYISRSISPAIGFTVAFIKWASAIIIAGTVAYMDVLILKDALFFLGLQQIASLFNLPIFQIIGSLMILWFFWFVNYIGVKVYGRVVIVLALLMLIGGFAMMFIGFTHNHSQFLAITKADVPNVKETNSVFDFILAVATLFWAYIGFTSIAQSAGEIKDWKRNLPRAFIFSAIIVTLYYVFYSAAFYQTCL